MEDRDLDYMLKVKFIILVFLLILIYFLVLETPCYCLNMIF